MRLDESVFVRLAPFRCLFGDLACFLVPLSVCAVCVPLISWIFCICYLFDKPTIEIDGEYAWQMVVMDLLDDARLSNRDVAVTDVGRMM